ncbi:ergothioneine biosynthesis protein EgtB [Fulvimarina sp. MAC8]|uniref:ergothioneine biosynthesis protein EgtB n=1 Tax=Fulvimarina sp. MAC8 TaxID=3162874 RepID=UPI0032EAA441
MAALTDNLARRATPAELTERYESVRQASNGLGANLSDADATVQSMPDASPAKWHLAHTTWFFETMILKGRNPGYKPFDESYNFLFNSYYESVGERQPRPKRGMVTRPALDEVMAYREYVDAAMSSLLEDGPSEDVAELVELGCHHEQQHQELLLTDILHLFAQSPLKPAFKDPQPLAVEARDAAPVFYKAFDGGIVEIGHQGESFAFDCEGPRHRTLLEPYKLADRLVSNGEWIDFIEDGGYRDPLLWLSSGWADILENGWEMPFYWDKRDGEYWSMTLRGFQPVDRSAPVTHLSYFEADAFAAWAGKRLPSEAEWENAAKGVSMDGNFADSGRLRPKPASADGTGLKQMFGDCWEWTRSAFSAYPGFKPVEGAVGEYNGKFMCGQFVLRGGSCVTPPAHIRPTYRNFFPPDARWQFSGLRLAEDN